MNGCLLPRLTALVLALLLLSGCGAAGTSGEAGEAHEGKEMALVQDGTAQCAIVYSSAAAEQVRLAAEDLQREILRLTGAQPIVKDDSTEADAEGYELLVGYTNREESKQALASLKTMGSYLVCVSKQKLVLASCLDAGVTEMVQRLCEELGAYQSEEETALILPCDFSVIGSVDEEGLLTGLPAFAYGSFADSKSVGEDAEAVIYQTSSDGCGKYRKVLEKNGFSDRDDLGTGEEHVFIYANDDTVVTLVEDSARETIRIEAAPFDSLPDAEYDG